MNYIINALKGIVIGVSNVIPGVSGGTMAVVMGIYDKIIYSVNNFFKDIKKNILFLGSLGIGAVVGILLFTNLIDYLLKSYNEQTNFFFIGLILGTAPLLFKKATGFTSIKVSYSLICFSICSFKFKAVPTPLKHKVMITFFFPYSFFL